MYYKEDRPEAREKLETFWGAEPQFNTTSVGFLKIIGDWESWFWTFHVESNRCWQNMLAAGMIKRRLNPEKTNHIKNKS
jgi:hypothetical protein